jgi:hypothetical protein
MLAYIAAGRLAQAAPGLVAGVGPPLRQAVCQHFWTYGLPDERLAGGVLALLVPPLAALSVFPLHALARRLYGPRTAWHAAALFPLLPISGQVAPDVLGVLPVTAAYALFVRGLDRREGWAMLAAGALIGAASFLSLGLAFALAPLGVYALLRIGVERPRVLAATAVRLAAGWLAPWALLAVGFGVDVVGIWQNGLGRHMTLDRPYARWVVFNLVDFLQMSGAPLMLLLAVGLPWLLRQRRRGWTVAMLGSLLALDLAGVTRGEVSRIWVFLSPAFTAAAAPVLRAWLRFRLPAFAVLLVLALAQLVVFSAYVGDDGPRYYDRHIPQTEAPALPHPEQAVFGGLIRLAGYGLEFAGDPSAGGPLRLTLAWQALGRPAQAYAIFTHLYDPASGTLAGQADAHPQGGQWPTACWQPGEVYMEEFEITVASGSPPGLYQLRTGLYDVMTGERLHPALGPAPGALTVQAEERFVVLREVPLGAVR